MKVMLIDYDASYINKQCMCLAEKALKNIDWKKYGVKIGIEYKIADKKPRTAALLAGVAGFFGLHGIGHIYVGQLKKGGRIMIFGCSLFVIIYIIFNIPFNMTNQISSTEIANTSPLTDFVDSLITILMLVFPFSIFFFYIFFWLWQIIDADKLAKYYNKHVNEYKKKPW